MTEFQSKTNAELEALFYGDQGIDCENYSFEEELKRYENYTPVGLEILVRIHVIPKEEKFAGSSLYKPDTVSSKESFENRFTRPVGLVIKLSKGCYDTEFSNDFKLTGPLCKPGDWIHFARNDVTPFAWDGIASAVLHQTYMKGVITKGQKSLQRIT